jgi:hypothetical protein
MIRELDKVTCAVSEKHGVMCLDFNEEKNWDDSDYYDFSHMTPMGAKKIGNYLFDHLKNTIE